mmetsp:Transcript_32047/g.110766  ORF Transcript_32047/g.110766 Transcript_32047/m.110766 type:complete len:264 (-) Transcript_32047:188-979(-)
MPRAHLGEPPAIERLRVVVQKARCALAGRLPRVRLSRGREGVPPVGAPEQPLDDVGDHFRQSGAAGLQRAEPGRLAPDLFRGTPRRRRAEGAVAGNRVDEFEQRAAAGDLRRSGAADGRPRGLAIQKVRPHSAAVAFSVGIVALEGVPLPRCPAARRLAAVCRRRALLRRRGALLRRQRGERELHAPQQRRRRRVGRRVAIVGADVRPAQSRRVVRRRVDRRVRWRLDRVQAVSRTTLVFGGEILEHRSDWRVDGECALLVHC